MLRSDLKAVVRSPAESEGFVAIAGGEFHTCGMRADGEAVCCGSDYCGESTPPRDRKFTDMSAGYFVACDLGAGGGAVCWDTLDISQPSPSTGERFEAKSAGSGYA